MKNISQAVGKSTNSPGEDVFKEERQGPGMEPGVSDIQTHPQMVPLC